MSKMIYIVCISGIYGFCNSDGKIRKKTWNRTFVKAFDDPEDAVAYVNGFDLHAPVSNSKARDLGFWDDDALMCCNDVVYARQQNYIQVLAENTYDLRRCHICVFVIESLRE